MCAGMLGLQAVVLFLVGIALPAITTSVTPAEGIWIGLGLGALCVVAAGLMRTSIGPALGWAVQVLSVALGFVVTAMFALGVVFLALYAGSYVLGAKIDQERAQRTV
jgi:Protein of unknown function (DUF4233)